MPKKVFSLKTVLMFLDQAISRLEFLHKNDYIHRDIKPENFMTGLKEDEIYLIDFGFA
jgi:serine/threonine protein kinase